MINEFILSLIDSLGAFDDLMKSIWGLNCDIQKYKMDVYDGYCEYCEPEVMDDNYPMFVSFSYIHIEYI